MNESLLWNVVQEPECWECHQAARILIQECIRPQFIELCINCPVQRFPLRYNMNQCRTQLLYRLLNWGTFILLKVSLWERVSLWWPIRMCDTHQLSGPSARGRTAGIHLYSSISGTITGPRIHRLPDCRNPVRRVVKWVSRIRGLFMLSCTADWLQCCFVTLSIIYFLCCPLFLFPSIF